MQLLYDIMYSNIFRLKGKADVKSKTLCVYQNVSSYIMSGFSDMIILHS